MPIVSSRDKEFNWWKRNAKTRQKRTWVNRGYKEKMRAKWFCCAFKSGFLQLICKASLIFESNFVLALSIKKCLKSEILIIDIWN